MKTVEPNGSPELIVKGKLADNERLKDDSNFLRGTITEDLQDKLSGGFRGDNFQLIRFHGMYAQDDRDIRPDLVARKLEPRKNVMLRCRLPGGIMKPEQWLGIDKFATENSDYQSIRITNRQTFQFHGVLKENIKPMHQWLNHLGLDSIATAGDVNRNVLCTSNPVESQLHREAYEWAAKLSEHLLPKTRAYAEIWLDNEKQFSTEDDFQDEEPILGKTYLPRKFKTTVIIPPHNDVDMHANDMNFVAVADESGKSLAGFNVVLGGGLSFAHGTTYTYPTTARDFGYIPVEKLLDCAAAVVTLQRDWGNRVDRKNAKTRYTIERVGLETFKAEVEKRMDHKFEEVRPYELTERGDRIGWIEGEDGLHHLTLFIENGRLIGKKKEGAAEIARIHKGDFRLTANQNLIVAGVAEGDKEAIESIAREYGLISDTTQQRQRAMACVSMPTCPLAMAEAERYLPEFIDHIEVMLEKHGIGDDYLVTRIAGCPNGCGRAMLAELGLVGKAPGRYNMYVGGNRAGTRVPKQLLENATTPEILEKTDELIGRWSKERNAGEEFGDFVIRAGIVKEVKQSSTDFWD
ncbi:assimilatory sulfite reductase (NADPH) hemoprotein subunit [Pelagicoccus mobilis]|uniref:Sulfite reductase [NADPH] hemoprotein beta-component n=1 Tax=Pelagicoccus mobilis TaxID=415221 RepID=A0A934VS79_9BACT|nr:assimilatory sulfite reductase (NADPH) hemoprotein subunit [Pelagicoccus mobilis]MBK1880162.1 assimilatory sulfite reductase (NADPH) hemoprotein subunit [Pelagicoccus mobilis]